MTNPLTSQWTRQTTWPHLHSARFRLKQHIQTPLHSTAGCQRNMKGAGRWCSGEVRIFWVVFPGWAGWNPGGEPPQDRKSTRLNSSHANISYAVFCLKKKNYWAPVDVVTCSFV